jgi:hypothetical protein
LRFPNAVDGSKRFTQRRPSAGGGYINSVRGVGPLLYNHHLLEMARIVAVLEGEKDCDRLTELHLHGRCDGYSGEIVAVTFGSAASWDASLAKLLNDPYKRISIIPNDDPAGAAYAAAVAASLTELGIDFRIVRVSRDRGEGRF